MYTVPLHTAILLYKITGNLQFTGRLPVHISANILSVRYGSRKQIMASPFEAAKLFKIIAPKML